MTIKEGGAELNLAKKDDVWTVKERADYPADFDKVSALLRKLWELKPVQDVKVGPSQLARLQLTEPAPGSTSGTLLDLKGAGDKRLAALLLGKKNLRNPDQPAGEGGGFAVGRYVMGAGRLKPRLPRFGYLRRDPNETGAMAEPRFHQDRKRQSRSPSPETTPAMNWTIVRDAAASPWKLADAKPGEELDNAKASSVASHLCRREFRRRARSGRSSRGDRTRQTFDRPNRNLRQLCLRIADRKTDGRELSRPCFRQSRPAERANSRGPTKNRKTKARLDQEFQTKQKQLTDKLATEQKLQARPYLIAKSTIDQMLKDRASLLAEKKPLPSPTPGTSPAGPNAAPLLKPPVVTPRPVASPIKASPSPTKQPK